MHLNLLDLRNGYKTVCEAVMDEGVESAPRGLATTEVLGATLVIEDPYDVLPVGVGRKVAPRLAAEEAIQVIAGVSDPRRLLKVSAHMEGFMDHGRFHGAYGPRIAPQLWPAVRRLWQDPSTRRAVINVWDPVQDLLVDGVRNYPCTTQLQFFVRDVDGEPRLSLYTTMRANDVWHGLAYDAFVFTQLQITVANALGLYPGPYYHHATSLHIYEEHYDAALSLESTTVEGPVVGGFGSIANGCYGFMDASEDERVVDEWRVRGPLTWTIGRALRTLEGHRPFPPTRSEEWYFDKVGDLGA